jgi:hypothetical protein
MADLAWIARARVHNDHRMEKKSDVAAVADDAEAALAPRMAGKIEFRRVLDRQDMASPRRPRRVLGGGRKHDFARHPLIVQKPAKAFGSSPIAAEPTQTRAPLAHEGGQKIGPPFWSRSSPNRPKSTMPCITRSSRESPMSPRMNRKTRTMRSTERCVYA